MGERFFALLTGERFFGAATRTDFGCRGDPHSGEPRAVAGDFTSGLAAIALPLLFADTGVRFVADVGTQAVALLVGGVFFCADDLALLDVLRGGVFFLGADACEAAFLFLLLFFGAGFTSKFSSSKSEASLSADDESSKSSTPKPLLASLSDSSSDEIRKSSLSLIMISKPGSCHALRWPNSTTSRRLDEYSSLTTHSTTTRTIASRTMQEYSRYRSSYRYAQSWCA